MAGKGHSSGRHAAEERRSPLLGEEWLGRLAALEGLADNHQNWTASLLREVRTLPRVIEEMAASARAEIDRQIAIEREAHQRTLRHLQEDIAACDADLDRVGSRFEEARATVARLATRLASEIEADVPEPAQATPAPVTSMPSAKPSNGSTASPARSDRDEQAGAAEPERSKIMLAVRGAKRATLGLSIREHLKQLPYIEDVALNNYAENVLRLEIVSGRPVLLDDALTWEQIPGIRIISVRADEIEAEMEDLMPTSSPLHM
jgi:hypothetical protein